MGTFLRTSRMNPALAARVEASVRRGSSHGASLDRRWTAFFRFAILFGAIGSLISLFVMQKREDVRLEQKRASLLDTVRVERARLRDADMLNLKRAVVVLVRGAGKYEGDIVAPEARGEGALRGVLGRPVVYVRGTLESFKNDESIAAAAQASTLDPFVTCLFNPPASRAEKALLERVRATSTGAAKRDGVHRLHHLASGLPLLQASWKSRVKAAKSTNDLTRYDRELREARFDETFAAARARLLLAVLDEPSHAAGPTELDGERPHDARVLLVDLESERPVLRLRRRLDPAAFSDRGRASHASGLDACALAMDVREAAAGAAARTGGAAAR